MIVIVKGRLNGDTEDADLELDLRPGSVVLLDGKSISDINQEFQELKETIRDLRLELLELEDNCDCYDD